MSYGFWAGQNEHETRAFFDKAYKRQGLAAWETRWHDLSVQARDAFLNVVKGPFKQSGIHSNQPGVSISRFSEQTLKELKVAGFVELKASKAKVAAKRVYAADGLYDFATHVRTLHKFHLLAPDRPSEFAKYVYHGFFREQLSGVLANVLRKARIGHLFQIDKVLALYVTHRRWPGWVVNTLDDPLAGRILDVIQEAGGSIPLAELPALIEGSHPDEVRSVLEKLVGQLALVEDLHPETLELMVGFLPAVHDEMIQAAKRRERPPLVVCEHPQEVGPDGGVIVNDLRAVLLEVASEPPQLRQDRGLFHREMERFQAALEPAALWLLAALKWNNEGRLNQAITWARALRLVKVASEGKRVRLRLTPKGQEWLSSGIEEQSSGIYDILRAFESREDIDSEHRGFSFYGMDAFDKYNSRDRRFLGEHVAVVKVEPEEYRSYHGDIKTEDQNALREHLDRALAALKSGVFYRLDSVASHIAFGEYNPLNRGLPLDEVAVELAHQSVPALEEEREKAGRRLIDAFMCRRLIPLGCVRAAIDEEGRLCIARMPRCEAYFGREIDPKDMAPSSEVTAKVVVQPDFSVVVIGLDSAPVAELVPFCERTSRGRGQGAMIMKITRESVINAVINGLKPEEIAARLERHASNKVPANVLRQVKDWSSWVRRVRSTTRCLLRCPDADTADRVMAALKLGSERLSDMIVAVTPTTLSASELSKLRGYGIIVQEEYEPWGRDGEQA